MSSRAEAVSLIAAQLKPAREAEKCHACGCFRSFVEDLAADGIEELAQDVALSRAVLQPQRYDCLGCQVCYPALAANALAEAFPSAGAGHAPIEARTGWPPLPGDYHVVRYGAPVAVCTLNSEGLAKQVADLAPKGLSIAGPLRTENLGIERLIQNLRANPNLRFLVLCGDDTQQAIGHLPGQSLQSLMENGLDEEGRILGALGKRPVLQNLPRPEVEAFRNQIALVTLSGESDPTRIAEEVSRCAASSPGAFESVVPASTLAVIRAAEPARLVLDPAGYVVIYPDRAARMLRAEHFTNAGVLVGVIEGPTPAAVCAALIERRLVTRLDHAAYLGQELARAEESLKMGAPYTQDKAPGTVPPKPSCGCSSCK